MKKIMLVLWVGFASGMQTIEVVLEPQRTVVEASCASACKPMAQKIAMPDILFEDIVWSDLPETVFANTRFLADALHATEYQPICLDSLSNQLNPGSVHKKDVINFFALAKTPDRKHFMQQYTKSDLIEVARIADLLGNKDIVEGAAASLATKMVYEDYLGISIDGVEGLCYRPVIKQAILNYFYAQKRQCIESMMSDATTVIPYKPILVDDLGVSSSCNDAAFLLKSPHKSHTGPEAITSLAHQGDERYIAGTSMGALVFYEHNKQKKYIPTMFNVPIKQIVSMGNHIFFRAEKECAVGVYEQAHNYFLHSWPQHAKQVLELVPFKNAIISVDEAGLQIRDAETLRLVQSYCFFAPKNMFSTSCHVLSDEEIAVVFLSNYGICRTSYIDSAQKKIATHYNDIHDIQSVAVDVPQKKLIVGQAQGAVRVFDIVKNSLYRSFSTQNAATITAVCCDANRVYAGDFLGKVYVFDKHSSVMHYVWSSDSLKPIKCLVLKEQLQQLTCCAYFDGGSIAEIPLYLEDELKKTSFGFFYAGLSLYKQQHNGRLSKQQLGDLLRGYYNTLNSVHKKALKRVLIQE